MKTDPFRQAACSLAVLTAIALLCLLPANADPAQPPGPNAPASGLSAPPVLALPTGLDVSGVKSARVVAMWDEDEQGRVQHLHFPPTGSAAVDAAIRAAVIAARQPAGLTRPSREAAHVFLFPAAGGAASASGPMVPMAGPTAPTTVATSTPAGDRPFPVLATAPGRFVDDVSGLDFPGLDAKSVTGKAFTVFWDVDETGAVSDVSVSPSGFPIVDEGLINHMLGLRYLPAAKDGKSQKAHLSHLYQF